jgi:hypothetical protein
MGARTGRVRPARRPSIRRQSGDRQDREGFSLLWIAHENLRLLDISIHSMPTEGDSQKTEIPRPGGGPAYRVRSGRGGVFIRPRPGRRRRRKKQAAG